MASKPKPPEVLWANATPTGRVWAVYTSERTARRGLVKGDAVLRYVLAPLPTRKKGKRRGE